jgi:hypothetical protein
VAVLIGLVDAEAVSDEIEKSDLGKRDAGSPIVVGDGELDFVHAGIPSSGDARIVERPARADQATGQDNARFFDPADGNADTHA